MKMKLFVNTILLTLIFSLPAFAQNVQGVFMVVKGDVKLTTSGKTDPAKVGTKVSPGDTITSGPDSRAKVVMADKNVINISPDSKITIEKYENDGKDKKNVELKVEYGKLRASVEQKYDGEKSKFNIKTPTAVAGVRGTDFLTGFNAANRTTQVITFSGTVAFGTPGPGGSIQNPVFVQQGQMTSSVGGKVPDSPKPVPKEELNKLNNETKADTAKSQPNSQEQNQNVADKSDKKDEKKEDKKDDKKDAPNKEQAEAKDSKKEDAKKREPASENADTNKRDPKNASSGPDSNEGGQKEGSKPAARSPSSVGSPSAGGGMIDMADMPTSPNGAMPPMPPMNTPIMLPPNIAPQVPGYMAPPPTSGKSNVKIIINRQ